MEKIEVLKRFMKGETITNTDDWFVNHKYVDGELFYDAHNGWKKLESFNNLSPLERFLKSTFLPDQHNWEIYKEKLVGTVSTGKPGTVVYDFEFEGSMDDFKEAINFGQGD